MMRGHYVLVDKKPVLTDLMVWAKSMENYEKRKVALNELCGIDISTVFLGLDHNFSGIGPPLLFETIIFGGKCDGFCERYSTWEEAEEGHRRAVEMVKKKMSLISRWIVWMLSLLGKRRKNV